MYHNCHNDIRYEMWYWNLNKRALTALNCSPEYNCYSATDLFSKSKKGLSNAFRSLEVSDTKFLKSLSLKFFGAIQHGVSTMKTFIDVGMWNVAPEAKPELTVKA